MKILHRNASLKTETDFPRCPGSNACSFSTCLLATRSWQRYVETKTDISAVILSRQDCALFNGSVRKIASSLFSPVDMFRARLLVHAVVSRDNHGLQQAKTKPQLLYNTIRF
jgi:hypothetical protein